MNTLTEIILILTGGIVLLTLITFVGLYFIVKVLPKDFFKED